MAHNFKLTGTYYVSIDGSDSNSGLTKDLPKRSIQAGLNLMTTGTTLIIGTGFYRESISRSFTAGTYTIIADGLVTLSGNGSNNFVLGGSSSTSITISITDITFINYSYISINNLC